MINIIAEELYYITDDTEKYFLSLGIKKINSVTRAGYWSSEKADNILSSLPRSLTLNDRWKKVLLEKNEEIKTNFIDFDNFEEKITKLYSLSQELREYDDSLSGHYKNIELELCDLYHYIEPSNFNVVDGYHAYVKIRNALRKRRQIKDEKLLLDNLKESNALGCNVNRINGSLDGLKNRKYEPRILDELFE